MKNKTYIFGIICVLWVVVGALFKTQHWPSAGIILTLGLSMFALVFMPVALIKSYRAETDKKLKTLYIVAYVSLLVVCIGALFKIQHWPGAGLFLIVGVPLPFVLFLPAYLLQIRKNKQLNYNNLLLVLFFFGYFAAITALLSLNVSKDILNEFSDSAAIYEQQTTTANQQTKAVINNLSLRNAIDSATLKSVQEIRATSLALSAQIKRIELGIMEAPGDNQSSINQDETIDFRGIDNRDNRYIYVNDIFKQKSGELKKKISEYRELLLSCTKNPDVSDFINTQLSTSDAWFDDKFDGKIMIAIMDALCGIKKSVAIAELETVRDIEGRL